MSNDEYQQQKTFMKRETGYYWVKRDGEWLTQFFKDDLWYDSIYCYESALCDNYFDEINETRILNPDEKNEQ